MLLMKIHYISKALRVPGSVVCPRFVNRTQPGFVYPAILSKPCDEADCDNIINTNTIYMILYFIINSGSLKLSLPLVVF